MLNLLKLIKQFPVKASKALKTLGNDTAEAKALIGTSSKL
jgi:hypothetical protein